MKGPPGKVGEPGLPGEPGEKVRQYIVAVFTTLKLNINDCMPNLITHKKNTKL